MSVAGKRIVVTGGARGIGAELAVELRARSAEVVTIDVLDGADLHCDVSDPASVEAAFAEVGSLHGLVNNAALLPARKPSTQITVEEWDQVFAVNVRGTFLCSRAAAGRMDPGGSIVNVASETAFTGSQGFSHYVSTKGAVVAMTRALANEYGPRGIRVNCVAPGFTPTEGSMQYGAYDASRTPLGRVMEPSDLLGTYCWLLSDDSAFVSGQTTLVNGGRIPY